MKFACHFGSTIYDGIDDIPNKARFMSDQGWCAKWDELDEHVIGASAAGQVTVNAAAMKARDIFWGTVCGRYGSAKLCGRLYLDRRDGTLQCVVPSTPETDRELLRKNSAG